MMQRVNVFVFLLCCQIALAFTTISNEKQATTCLRETKEDLVVLAKKLNPLIGFYDPRKYSLVGYPFVFHVVAAHSGSCLGNA
mmetsp:Transcript_11943/g.18320  ORF Transcript_11943/g.18320 Transcript_11943/m.18320 type:complete len:83 (+) Transcript_11943:107-355(+)